jgi:hypothetical protein
MYEGEAPVPPKRTALFVPDKSWLEVKELSDEVEAKTSKFLE